VEKFQKKVKEHPSLNSAEQPTTGPFAVKHFFSSRKRVVVVPITRLRTELHRKWKREEQASPVCNPFDLSLNFGI
jgi:hypothetical protein